MDRNALGFLSGAVILALVSGFLFVQNRSLRSNVNELTIELASAEKDRDNARKRARRAEGGQKGKVGKAPQRGGARPGLRPGRPAGAAPGGNGRQDEIREKMQEKAVERVLTVVGRVGAAEGWTPSQIDGVSSVLEESFVRSTEIRDRVRAKELDPTAAREELGAAKQTTNDALIALLGEEGHMTLRKEMRAGGAPE